LESVFGDEISQIFFILKPFSMFKNCVQRDCCLHSCGGHKIIYFKISFGMYMFSYYENRPWKFQLQTIKLGDSERSKNP